MNRSLFRIAAYLQLGIAILFATGCTPTQPFFLNESPDLQYYLNSATRIEYPDVDVESLAETTQAARPLTIGNHDYQFWDLKLEECVSIALQNAKFLITTSGIAEERQNVAEQFIGATSDQFSSIYDVAIQQSSTQSVPVTVDGQGNRVYQRGVLRANQIGGVEDALAEFDAQASGFISYNATDRVRNVLDTTVTRQLYKATDVTQQATLSKRLATGGIATLRQQIAYTENNAPLGGASRVLPSDYTAIMEAQIQHPLMRNRGTLVNRIPVVLASLNEDLSIAEFELQVRNLVRDVEVAYWNLYVSYRNVATAIIGRNSAIATAKFAQLAFEEGTGTRQELAQAVEQYYRFRGLLESALAGSNLPGSDRFGVYGAERRLRELLGLAPTDGRLIRPIDEPTLARVEYDWNESIAQTLYLSPELRQTKVRIKQLELELISAKNQILPEVNLSLLYRWVGVGDELGFGDRPDATFPEEGSSALASLTSGQFQEGGVRLEVTPPAFGARRELTRINGAELRLNRERAHLLEKERLLISQLSGAVGKVATHYQLTQTNAQRWQAAEQEVEARLAEFKGGRSPVNVVLQSQQRRAEAQIDYYRALSEYNKSLNYVNYLKGTMLANNSITLAEGPWNKKAYWDALERARERSAGHELQYGVSRPGVVREGPLRDAASAEEIIGSGVTSFGETLPPEVPSTEGIILEGANGRSIGLDLEPYRQPVEVDDQPLSELGSSSAELFSPGVSIQRPGTSVLAPSPATKQSGTSGMAPLQDARQNSVAPMSYQAPVGGGQAFSSGGQAFSGGGVSSQAGTPVKVQSQPAPQEFAPAAVRRKPIPAN